MEEAKDGGAAFPVFTEQYNYGLDRMTPTTVEPGMSLRDYFAAKVFPVAAVGAYRSGEDFLRSEHYEDAAMNAYALADAMLKARQA